MTNAAWPPVKPFFLRIELWRGDPHDVTFDEGDLDCSDLLCWNDFEFHLFTTQDEKVLEGTVFFDSCESAQQALKAWGEKFGSGVSYPREVYCSVEERERSQR